MIRPIASPWNPQAPPKWWRTAYGGQFMRGQRVSAVHAVLRDKLIFDRMGVRPADP